MPRNHWRPAWVSGVAMPTQSPSLRDLVAYEGDTSRPELFDVQLQSHLTRSVKDRCEIGVVFFNCGATQEVVINDDCIWVAFRKIPWLAGTSLMLC